MDAINALAVALGERDESTRAHCDRTVHLSLELGRHCGLVPQELERLRLAAAWHDVGKIGIPDRVLLKPGRLEADEWQIMRTHAERGQRILAAFAIEGMDEVALAVRHHHEAYDGHGYPDGLAGEEIPILSRIIALADAYDAMAMPRPYHRPRRHREIMGVLGAEGGQKFDPHLLARFARLIESPNLRTAPS